MNFLLSDEQVIDNTDLSIRKQLYNEFIDLPVEFLSKMRHLQPQVGCFNNCGFCSKFSVCKSEYWDEKALRNIISAIKYTALKYTGEDLLLAWERKEHRVGVTFPYLNNDIGSYPYLDKFINLCYKELGVRTRISTVGFSRHNENLNAIHKKINSSVLLFALAGVRLSISQYGRVWEDKDSSTSLKEYEQDLINFLKIYRPYFDMFGSGSRKMCVELRYNPLVVNSPVLEFKYNENFIIATGNYLFISKEENIEFKESHITNPYLHALALSEKPIIFKEYNLPFTITTEEELINYIKNNKLDFERESEFYMFSNKDGYYYAINPHIENNGNYGFNIYPETEKRKTSGYIITERFLLNAFYNFKSRYNMNLRDRYKGSTWEDVNEVIKCCKKQVSYYKRKNKLDKANYIEEHILPVINVYIRALKGAEYPSDCFFDSRFTIDTGMICNLGRAINYFKGLTSFVNEPMTPTHERNYGRHCSTMKQENYVWKLACGFNNTINIEKLDLFKTASEEGQTSFRHDIVIENFNKTVNNKDNKYLYPGVKE